MADGVVRAWLVLLVCLLSAGGSLAAAADARPPALTRGTVTGVKLPRYASLRVDTVNLRRGPGQRYPIDWVYHRRGLPVQIVREFDTWRQVRTQDGTTGWIYHALLVNRRDFIVTAAEVTLHRGPHPRARPVAHLQHGVVGRLLHCAGGAAWCQVSVGDHVGYLLRAAIWGSDPGEAVGP